jgi:CARDB
MFPSDFIADVSGIDGTKADLRIRYGVNNRPDPSIRPWPAGPGREWQSPDIEVRNARNAANSAWFNVPWEGNPNTIVAKVKNNSTAQAPQVRVNFAVKNYNVGGAPETFLGSDVRDIGPGATVEFSTSWTPPSQGHFCVVVRIPLYQVPTALSVVELTELNNLAQSNYDRFISKTSSPATREVTSVEVGNPYQSPARIFLIGNQSNPIYRTFIEHQWVVLNPGETRNVQVMFEYSPTGDKRADDAAGLSRADVQEFERIPNEVGVHAVVEDPRDTRAHALEVLGGAQVQVVKGRGTRFDDVKPEGEVLTGRVVASDEKRHAPRGQLILTFSVGRGKSAICSTRPRGSAGAAPSRRGSPTGGTRRGSTSCPRRASATAPARRS